MPISLNQENRPGYAITSFLSAVPAFFLSGATYSFRHFALAWTDKESRISHLFLGLLELIPVVGGIAALADWYYNKSITTIHESSHNVQKASKRVSTATASSSLFKEKPSQACPKTNFDFSNLPGPEEGKKHIKNAFKPLTLKKLTEETFIIALEVLHEDSENTPISQEQIEFLIYRFKEMNPEALSLDFDEKTTRIKSFFSSQSELQEADAIRYAIEESKKSNAIVQNPLSIEEFKNHHYPEGWQDSLKFRKRLDAIATYFGKQTVVPVKGDGDCFFNALVPGLLTKANKDKKFHELLVARMLEFQKSYRKDVITGLQKEDFEFVIQTLTSATPFTLHNEAFNERFTKVLRYMCVIQNESRSEHKLDEAEIPKATGTYEAYTDVKAIGLVNEIFGTSACCAVLEKSVIDKDQERDLTSAKADEVFLTRGDAEPLMEDLTSKASTDDQKADFVLLLNQNHFSCLL